MNGWLRRFRGLRPTASILVLALLISCHSWRLSDRPLPQVLSEDDPEQVRVTLADDRTWTLRSPRLAGDSLTAAAWEGGPRRTVALADIRKLEVQTISGTKTVLLAAGIGITTLLVAAAVGSALEDPAPRPSGDMASCPLVYSWDGEAWRLDSGTFGGAIMPSLARTDVDNLEHLVASPEGIVRLRVTNELSETEFVDALSILAVDHAPGVTVSPAPDGTLHAIGASSGPLKASDLAGRDVLPRLAVRDGWNWESALATPAGDTGDPRDGVVIEFPRPRDAPEARLVVDAHNTPWASFLLKALLQAHGSGLAAWYAAMDTDPERARRFFGPLAKESFLDVAVWTPDGWVPQGLVWEAGPEIVKRQIVPLDLRGVAGESVRVRLSAPPSFWLIDHVAIDYGSEPAFTAQTVEPGPTRDHEGRDVRPRIAAIDGDYLVMETGDATELSFAVPALPAGMTRTYLLRSTGWYRIHIDGRGEPDAELLSRIASEPGGVSRIAVERRDRALAARNAGR